MLKQRIITAVLLAPVLLGIVVYGNQHLFALLIFVIQAAAFYEWLKINQLRNFQAAVNAVVLSVFSLYLAAQLNFYDFNTSAVVNQQMIDVFMGFFIAVWVGVLVWLKNHQWGYANQTLHVVVKAFIGVVAIILFGVAMHELYNSGEGRWIVLALFFLIWVADVGAYASGKTLGKHKLALNISPGKTWEGVIGAQVLVAIYAVLVASHIGISWQESLMIMIPVALFSVIGDLAASLGKRQAKVKDSSNLLPGHGGFIDRFDSLIAAAPLFYLLLIHL